MKILLVCTGNTCRSPLAEKLLQHKIAALGLPISVQSAGIHAAGGEPMSEPMQKILIERGINVTHQSQPLNAELLEWADLILTMTRLQQILLMTKGIHVETLLRYVGEINVTDIDDPFGKGPNAYQDCAQVIEDACDRLISELQSKLLPC